MSDNQNNIPIEETPNVSPIDETNENINETNENTVPNEPVEETESIFSPEPNEPQEEITEVENTESPNEETEAEAEAEPTESENTESESTEVEPDSQEVKEAFDWEYTNTYSAPTEPPKNKKTGLIFGITLSSIFLFAILVLVAAIAIGTITGSFRIGNIKVDFNTTINSSNGSTVEDPQDASASALEAFKHSTVVVMCDRGIGTGIILDTNGMIVTNHHVIEESTSITIALYDGRIYSATLIGSDSYYDIAVVKINAPDLIPAVFANSEEVYTGERVYAVGTPAGADFAWSVSAGIVSHPYREFKFYNSENLLEKSLYYIQTDTLVNPGNSGGPLINKNCEVIGIVNMRLKDEYIGMGFAIPTNTALPIVQSIIESYTVKPNLPSNSPQLGISGIVVQKGERFTMTAMGYKENVTVDYYNKNPEKCVYATHSGIYVLSTTEGFDSAEKLKVGDIIIGANKTYINSMEDLRGIIASSKIGDTLSLTIIRDNEQITVNVILGRAIQ